MTIYELSLEYGRTAAELRCRIVALEQAGKAAESEAVKRQMENRARSLRSMYRDVRKVAQYLERYYGRQPPKKKASAKRREAAAMAMRTVSYDNTFGMVDLAKYVELMADDNTDQINRLKRNLAYALRQDITECQRKYMLLYYGQGLSVEAVAQQCGVNKSTVSRTLKRGRRRLYRCLRYGASNLLEQANS